MYKGLMLKWLFTTVVTVILYTLLSVYCEFDNNSPQAIGCPIMDQFHLMVEDTSWLNDAMSVVGHILPVKNNHDSCYS